jgi:RHS repeat-associated protein
MSMKNMDAIGSHRISRVLRRALLTIASILVACPVMAELPSVKLLTAPLVTPQNAITYYNGLPTTATTGVAALGATAPEIQELSRALGKGRYTATTYATTVYEYVRNNIGMEFRFGLSKGGRGALIDQSGTPFDQAHLMVSLLTQGGVSATFNVGTLTLTGAQFTAWSGISDAKAACQYLADGGIPATVNSATSCSSITSGTSISAVTMLHPWVVANSAIYDPSYKVQIKKTGIDLATAMGCAGSPNPTCATSLLSTTLVPAITTSCGVTGVNCVQNVNRTGIETQLNTYATNLQHYIQNYDVSNNTYLAIEDAIGGLTVDTSQSTGAGSLLPSSAYSAANYTWNNNAIPDAFRTTMTVQVDQINQLLFADEIAGQRVRMWGYADVSAATTTTEHFTLYAEYKALVRSDQAGVSGGTSTLNLIIHHPYAANSGTYASETIGTPIVLMLNDCANQTPCDSTAWHTGVIAIMQAFGEQGPSHATYYADLQRRDKVNGVIWADTSDPKNIYPGMTGGGPKAPPHVCTTKSFPTTPDDQNICFQQQEATVIATWLTQTSRARWMAGNINGVALHNHHSVGAALASDLLTGTETILSAQTTLSADSLTNSAPDRTAAFMGVAAAMNRLEGGIFEQANGALDGGAGISMMTRANDNHVPFLDVTAANVTTVTSALASNSWVSSSISAVTSYATASPGYELIVPLNGNAGSVAMTNGTAYFNGTGLAAYGANNDRIAYLATLPPFYVKGSGGAVAYDPANEAEQAVKVHDYSVAHRKSYSVNLANGSLQLTTAPDLITGNGAFPLSLSFQRVFDASAIGNTTFIDASGIPQSTPTQTDPADLGAGWTHNLAISAAIQSDAFVGMGQDSALDATQMITGMFVQRWLTLGTADMRSRLANVFATHWMINSLNRNVVVVARPPRRTTFVKLPDGKFDPGAGNYEVLTQSGIQTLDGFNGNWVWNATGVSFTLVDKDGSSMNLVQSLPGGGTTGLAAWNYPYNYIFVPGIWTFPTGVKLTFSYATTGTYAAIQQACLTGVTSNLGRFLTFSDPCGSTYPRTVTDDAGRSISVALIGPTTGQVGGADGSVTTYDYTVPAGLVTTRPAAGIFKVFTPLDQTTPAYTIAYDSLFRVKSVTDNSQPTQFTSNYFVSGLYGTQNQSRGESVDATGAVTTQYFDRRASLLQSIDPLGNITSYAYDAHQRLVSHVYPELNTETYSYDVRHNRLTQVRHPKPGSTLGITPTVTTTYVEGPSVSTCVYPASCNKIASIQDARLNTTSFSYLGQNTTTGTAQLQRILAPAVTAQIGGVGGSAQTDYCYSSITASGQTGAISFPVAAIQKVDASTNQVNSLAYSASKLVLQSATQDPSTTTYVPPGTAGGTCTTTSKSGALGLTTNFTFDSIGNVQSIDGPIVGTADTTTYAFDSMRRLTWVAAPLSQLTRYCYDKAGELLSTNKVRPLSATSTAPATSTDPNAATETTDGSCPTAFPSAQWLSETRTYFPTGDLRSVADAASHTTVYAYDRTGRQQVVQDADGRQTATTYDLAGETTAVWKGGSGWIDANGNPTAIPSTWNPSGYAGSGAFRYEEYCYGTPCYSHNGKALHVLDANNNVIRLTYDGLDRLQFTYFSDPTNGQLCAPSANDGAAPSCVGQESYEQYSYDASDNKTSLRTRNAAVIGYHYDQLNRQDSRTPAGQGVVTTGFDLLREPLLISKAANGSNPAHTTAYTFDAVGRKKTETNDGLTVSLSYDTVSTANDNAERLTRITWPDNYFVAYAYDAASRLSTVRENSTTTSTLASYSFDVLSRRQQLCLGGLTSACNSTNVVSYGYESDGQLHSLSHTMNSAAVAFSYGRNQSYQITTLGASDAFYLPYPQTAATTSYTPNALNEYAAIAGQSSTYDLNGNLLTWYPASGKATYTYDSENRLTSAAINGSATASITYDYDGVGRRVSKTVSGTKTTYLLDGDEEIGEYSGSTLLRRYILGSSIDDRIAHAEGSAITNPTKTYYHVNHQGSVIAVTDATGTVAQRVGHDEYGNGSTASGEPFGYTGRRFDPETGLYYYRARYYLPQLGRFLQVDPVGYQDNLNVYGYGAGDPVNNTDPSGEFHCVLNDNLIQCYYDPDSWIDTHLLAAWAWLHNWQAVSASASGPGNLPTSGQSYSGPTAPADATSTTPPPPNMEPNDPNKQRGSDSGGGQSDTRSDKPASTPIGSARSPIYVEPGTNAPANINGVQYTGHALDQMQSRGMMPSVVEDTILHGVRSEGYDGAAIYTSEQARVIINPNGSIKTVMQQ